MAITRTNLTGGNNTANTQTVDTASVSPTGNRLITCTVISFWDGEPPPTPTISGGGMTTWTQVVTDTISPSSESVEFRVTLFRAMQASPGSGAITLDHGSTPPSEGGFMWTVEEWDGVDTGGTNGSAAIVQSGSNSTTGATALSVALAAFADATNNVSYTVAGFHANIGNPGVSGYAQTDNQLMSNPTAELEAEWATGEDTSVDWTWVGSTLAAAVAVEIAVAPATTEVNATATASATASVTLTVRRAVAATASGTSTTALALLEAPAAPSALAKNTVGSDDANMVLTWTDNSTNEDNFHLQRSPQGAGTWATVSDAIAADAVTYTDATVAAETAYDYRLRAENTAGQSSWVELLNVSTAPARVTGLAAVPGTNNGEIDVSWTDNSAAETQYNVYHRVNGSGDPYDVDVIAANSVSHTLTGLTPNTQYQIDVRPENGNGVSGSNGTVTAIATGVAQTATAAGVGTVSVTPNFVWARDVAPAGVGAAAADITAVTALTPTGRRMVVIGVEPNAAQRVIRFHLWYIPVVYAVQSQGTSSTSAAITVA